MHAKPNGVFNFTLHPTYWVAVCETKKGEVVDGAFISTPYAVIFEDNKTSVKGHIN